MAFLFGAGVTAADDKTNAPPGPPPTYCTDGMGYVPYWLALGSFATNMPTGSNAPKIKLLDVEFMSETAAVTAVAGESVTAAKRTCTWKPVIVEDCQTFVECGKALGNGKNTIGYMLAYLVLDAEEKGCTVKWNACPGKLFVNGCKAGEGNGQVSPPKKGQKYPSYGQTTTKGVDLKKGVNSLLFKLARADNGWGLGASILRADGTPLAGARISPAPEGKQPPEAAPWKAARTSKDPLVLIDQIGYRTKARKLVIVASDRQLSPALALEVVNDKTGKSEWALKEHPESFRAFNYDKDKKPSECVTHLDLTGFQKSGRFFIRIHYDGRDVVSHRFNVADDVYREAGLAPWRSFYFQRADTELPEKYAGLWAHKLSNNGPGQSGEARVYKWKGAPHWCPVGEEVLEDKPYDVRGGWWDAGNFDKYMGNTAGCIFTLLNGLDLIGPLMKDNQLNIPESGNGTPDLMDEVRFGIDFIMRMNDGTGAAFGRAYIPPACPPESTDKPTQLIVTSSGATINRAAVLAYAAAVWKDFKQQPDFQKKCFDEAMKSWNLLKEKPHPWPEDPKKPGKAAYTGEWFFNNYNDMKTLTAASFFRCTGEKEYDDIVREYVSTNAKPGSVAYVYCRSQGADPELVKQLKNACLVNGDKQLRNAGTNRIWGCDAPFWWGSNGKVGGQAMACVNAAEMCDDAEKKRIYLDAAEEFLHYLNGRNPVDYCFFTNMKQYGAERSVMSIFHSWLAPHGNKGTPQHDYSSRFAGEGPDKIGPPPGIVPGGPTGGNIKNYTPSCGNYETGEPCLGYQAPCSVLAVYFALKPPAN